MKPTVDALKVNFTLLDALAHDNIVPFLRIYLRKPTKATVTYYALNVVMLLALGYVIGFLGIAIGSVLSFFFLGFAIALLFIPLHEYLHIIAYRLLGAKNASVEAHWKKFYFLAMADGFVTTRKEFRVVALAPIVVISTFLIGTMLWVSQDVQLVVLGALLGHTSMCSGDFGLLSYFEYHNDKTVVTYDDKAARTTYFYQLLAP